MGGRYSNVRKGYAEDLHDGNFYKSGWERSFARFLTFLQNNGVIEGYEYEPFTFSFQGMGYARGPFTYCPDFIMRFNPKLSHKKRKQLEPVFGTVEPGSLVYVEVKGQETGKDRNKWRRFRKHINEPLIIIKRDEMLEIQNRFPVVNWESYIR
jgi:hypothetical protein